MFKPKVLLNRTSQEEGLAPAVGRAGQATLPDLFYSFLTVLSSSVMLERIAIQNSKGTLTMTPEERNDLIAKYAAGYDEVMKALNGFPCGQFGRASHSR